MINVSSRKEGSAAVIQISGRIDAVTAPDFERACLEVVHAGEKIVVLDLGGVLYISSAGLRSLLIIGRELQASGGVLRLANVSSLISKIFELSNFHTLFPFFDSVEKATAN